MDATRFQDNALNSPPVTAIRLMRGVGDSDADSSWQGCQIMLIKEGIDPSHAAEINWSWQQFIRRPYSYKSSDGTAYQDDVVNLEFLRYLGHAIRTTAMREALHAGVAAQPLSRVKDILFLILQSWPSLVVLIAAAVYFGLTAVAWVVCGIVIFAASCTLAVSFLGGRAASVFGAVRGVSLLLLWPIIFVFVLPATWLWKWVLLLIPALVAYPMYEQLLQSELNISLIDGIPVYEASVGGFFLFVISSILLVSFFAILAAKTYLFMRKYLAPILKILADVILYTGSAAYRNALMCYVRDSLNSINPATRNIVIVAHSLGSVIAVDVLREFWTPPPGTRVTLITAGSPLARLFHRFFPESYPSASILLSQVASRVPQFRWINVYRPNDPIGAAIGLPPEADISTGQHHLSWLRAHVGYWADARVHELVHASLAASPVRVVHQVAPIELATSHMATVPTPGGLWLRWLVLCVLIFIGGNWAWGEYLVPVIRESLASTSLEVNGSVVMAHLYRSDQRVSAPNYPSFNMPRLVLAFTPEGGGAPVVAKISYEQCGVRTSRNLFKGAKLNSATIPGSDRQGVFISVHVRYLKDDPSVYEILECGSKPRAIDWISAGSLGFSVILNVGVFSYALVSSLGLSTLAAFAGLSDEQYGTLQKSLPKQDSYFFVLGNAMLVFFASLIPWIISMGS